jgi:hypothetical protein
VYSLGKGEVVGSTPTRSSKFMVYENYDLSDPDVRAVLLKHYQSELEMTRRSLAGARKNSVLKSRAATLEKQELEFLAAIENLL